MSTPVEKFSRGQVQSPSNDKSDMMVYPGTDLATYEKDSTIGGNEQDRKRIARSLKARHQAQLESGTMSISNGQNSSSKPK